MIAVEYRINGRRVTPQSSANRLEAAILRRIDLELHQKLGDVWCPHHQQWPRVTAVGRSADDLTFQVGGCCLSLKDRANAAIYTLRRN